MEVKSRSSRQKGRWIAVAAWAALIFLLSSMPGSMLEPLPTFLGWDKLGHMILYGALGVLLYRAVETKRFTPWLIWLFCVVYGLTDELHQYWIPGRFADVSDLVADAVGAAAALFWWNHHAKVVMRKNAAGNYSDIDNTIG